MPLFFAIQFTDHLSYRKQFSNIKWTNYICQQKSFLIQKLIRNTADQINDLNLKMYLNFDRRIIKICWSTQYDHQCDLNGIKLKKWKKKKKVILFYLTIMTQWILTTLHPFHPFHPFQIWISEHIHLLKTDYT